MNSKRILLSIPIARAIAASAAAFVADDAQVGKTIRDSITAMLESGGMSNMVQSCQMMREGDEGDAHSDRPNSQWRAHPPADTKRGD